MRSDAQKCAPRIPAHMASIKAMLYYNDSGKFSENLIDNANFTLWNTNIGEGSAAGPSNSLFVVVEVIGDARKVPLCGSDSLIVILQAKGKPAVRQQIKRLSFEGHEPGVIGSVVPKEHHFEGFWLHDTGCEAVTIRAQVNQQTAVRKTVGFECGE
jgi:hypothetical protein